MVSFSLKGLSAVSFTIELSYSLVPSVSSCFLLDKGDSLNSLS
jgi:hypothetical protein